MARLPTLLAACEHEVPETVGHSDQRKEKQAAQPATVQQVEHDRHGGTNHHARHHVGEFPPDCRVERVGPGEDGTIWVSLSDTGDEFTGCGSWPWPEFDSRRRQLRRVPDPPDLGSAIAPRLRPLDRC